ncbi:uncharacterized protein LOC129598268 [Paramacrobiotus metropolitanus]|uniref:uncharacterized protein LOC129598268 n=1 Tax=Paramacrobiotus metropolitanus TaxID=2943436 RepID=UPI002445DAD6|nr:uncharacterized protein LOC129598268 [Paramacrobiotus metropolitanus]
MHFLCVVVLLAVSSCGVTALWDPQGNCRKSAPVGYAWDSVAVLGVWYQYMYGPKEGFQLNNLTNPVEENRAIGWIYDNGGTKYASATFVTSRQDVAPYSCWASYATQNTSCNGYTTAFGYFGGLGTGETGGPRNFYKLYLDPNFFYVRSDCFDQGSDTLTIQNCKQPGVSVWTRKMPKDITPLENKIILDVLDDRLQFYCVTGAQMAYNQWVDLPPCDYIEKPQNFMNDIRYAEEHVVSKCHSASSGGGCAPASFY